MRRPMDVPFMRAGIAVGLIALVLIGCTKAEEVYQTTALPNISLERTPSTTDVGWVNTKRESVAARVGDGTIVTAFRASGCGQPAPDFERMMRSQVKDGLRVPDGITLYDAGVGHYTSTRCGARTPARAIGVFASRPGTYELRFFGGKTIRTVKVK